MLIDKVYSAVSLLANKDQVSGVLTPAEFNKYAELAQRELIEEIYNRPDGMGMDSTNKVMDDYAGVKKQVSIVLLGGQAAVPSDYNHFSHAQGTYIFKDQGRVVPVELVRDSEWAERLASEVNKPSKRFPIMRLMDTYFDVYPQDLNNINLTYIKVPLQPWWNYTLSGSTPVFAATGGTTTNPNSGVAAGNSTDFEIGTFEELVWKICSYFGINTQDGNLYQASKTENAD